MKNSSMNYIIKLLLVSFFLFSCSDKQPEPQREQQGKIDTPEFHVERADEALLEGNLEGAEESYQNAVELSPNYSDALIGLALIDAKKASNETLTRTQQYKRLKKINSQVEKAEEASTEEGKERIHIFKIRIYTALQYPRDWYEKANESFDEVVEKNKKEESAFFFMAKADAIQGEYAKATEKYNKVLELQGIYKEQADKELEIIQKIQRARPGSKFGKNIAFVEKITKADVAGLFISELKLDRLYGKNKNYDTKFKIPANQQGMNTSEKKSIPKAMDIGSHPLKQTIAKMMKLGVKGLEADASHKFHPNKEITRAEFALMIQDILIKIAGDEKLATKYIGEASPFPDVRNDVYYYNAARVVTQRNLMAVTNKVTNTFNPQSAVHGADALLTLRDLKGALESYTK